MKKKMGIFMALLFSLLLAVNVWADDGAGQKPDYFTDYYMIVECADGGIDIYAQADFESDKLNDELILNGTALHIEGEKTDKDNKHWSYVQYHGMYGYVPSDNLKPVTLAEAAESEYRTYGGKDVEFDVKIKSDDGYAVLYRGPGEQFGKVQGAEEIKNGTSIHVTQYVETAEGRAWGKITTNSGEGWVDLKETDYAENEALVNMIEGKTTEEGEDSVVDIDAAEGQEVESAESKTVPELTATPTPEPTATPTPEPTATPTPEPTATSTPTPEPTATTAPTATEAPTSTPTTEPTKEATATPTEEVTPTEEAQSEDAAGENVKAESTWNPMTVGAVIALLIIIILLAAYFFRKKK